MQKIFRLCYIHFFFWLIKAKLQVLKFEFLEDLVKSITTNKLAIKWQNFARVELLLNFAFKIRP